MINSNGGTKWDGSVQSGDTWTRTNDPCPFGWRLPIRVEIQTLGDTDKVTFEWTTVNGINGGTFTNIDTSNSVFFPVVGWRDGGGRLNNASTLGLYWSSTLGGGTWFLGLYNGGVNAGNSAGAMIDSFACVVWRNKIYQNQDLQDYWIFKINQVNPVILKILILTNKKRPVKFLKLNRS